MINLLSPNELLSAHTGLRQTSLTITSVCLGLVSFQNSLAALIKPVPVAFFLWLGAIALFAAIYVHVEITARIPHDQYPVFNPYEIMALALVGLFLVYFYLCALAP